MSRYNLNVCFSVPDKKIVFLQGVNEEVMDLFGFDTTCADADKAFVSPVQEKKQISKMKTTKTEAIPKRKKSTAPSTTKNGSSSMTKTVPKSPSLKSPCCDKNHRLDLREWDGAHFTKSFQKNRSNVPTHCSGYCKKQRLVGDDVPKRDVDVTTCVKITKSKQAAICPNAMDPKHPCVYAMCPPCKLMMDLVATGQKKELHEVDGSWVVVDIEDEEDTRPAKIQRISQRRTIVNLGEKGIL